MNYKIVVEALEKLNGRSHLSDIYDKVKELHPEIRGRYKNERSYQGSIRAALEINSSDSDSYKGKNDTFRVVYEKGDGYWGLRDSALPTGIGNDVQTETIQEIPVRLVQSKFRNGLLEKYHHTCPITGISIHELLIASHIKPWKYSSGKERMDINNGILLSSHFDALFDKGFISFNDLGEMLCKKEIFPMIKDNFKFKCRKIEIDEEMKPYLEWHRKNYHFENNHINLNSTSSDF